MLQAAAGAQVRNRLHRFRLDDAVVEVGVLRHRDLGVGLSAMAIPAGCAATSERHYCYEDETSQSYATLGH